MKTLTSKVALFFLSICTLVKAMNQPPKSPQDLLVGAAGAGNMKGLNFHIKTQKMSPNTNNSAGRNALGMAAGNGQLESVQFLLDAGANPNIKDAVGLTPLAWAVLILNQNKTEQNYLDVINALLSKGARLDIFDNTGLSILHGATRAGNINIIKLLLNVGAKNIINHEGAQDKGRTPVAEALRAARDAIIHVDLENQNIDNKAAFASSLNEAIEQLKKKETKKLATVEIINVINLLKQNGARTNITDALGHTLDYYINEVQLISDAERAQLLQALGYPITSRVIKYNQAHLPQAIEGLKNLRTLIQSPVLFTKINMLIWTIEAAQQESNQTRKYDILRIGMAFVAKIKEILKTSVQDKAFFNDIENQLNVIRTILRDNALILSGKAKYTAPKLAPITKPVAAAQPPPIVQLSTKPLLKPSATPAPAQKIPLAPATRPAPAAAQSVKTTSNTPNEPYPILTTITNETRGFVIVHLPGKDSFRIGAKQYWQGSQQLEGTIIVELKNGKAMISADISGKRVIVIDENQNQRLVNLSDKTYRMSITPHNLIFTPSKL